MKVGKVAESQAGMDLRVMGTTDSGEPQSRMQKFATSMSSKMHTAGQIMGSKLN